MTSLQDFEPPQVPVNFDIDGTSLVRDAEQLVSLSTKVWDNVARVPPDEATFDNAILPIIQSENTRTAKTKLIAFFQSISPSKSLRDASQEASSILARDTVSSKSRQDVFAVVDAVWHRGEDLDAESVLFLKRLREEFLEAGHGVADSAERARLTELREKLEVLRMEYTQNINSDVSGMWLTLAELDGVPQDTVAGWKANGDHRWMPNKTPSFRAVLANAVREDVRRKVWCAWEDRLKDVNAPLLKDMLLLRDEIARMLGYGNHAHRLESGRIMATDDAVDFLNQLRPVLLDLGQSELETLRTLKAKHTAEASPANGGTPETFFLWDWWFYGRRAKMEAFNVDQQLMSEYFPFERSVSRMLSLLEFLFGVVFVNYAPDTPGITIWHPSVVAYAVWDGQKAGEEFLGYLYLDPFPRAFKYGHRGHYNLQPGFTRPDGSRHYPSAALVTNYTPPTATRPSLLTHGELVSCFHELGHALHNLTGRTRYARFHGGSIPRDFIEIPSRVLEHFFWDRNIIRWISGHFTDPTGLERLPDDMIDNLIAVHEAEVGLSDLLQLAYSLFDLKVHSPASHDEMVSIDLQQEFNKVRRELCMMGGPEDVGSGTEGVHGYSRLRFVNGYDSSYYSYLLADAFSHDVFATKFRPLLRPEDAQNPGDIVTAELRADFGHYRRLVLQPSGSVDSYLGLLREFLGRDASPRTYVDKLGRTTRKMALSQ